MNEDDEGLSEVGLAYHILLGYIVKRSLAGEDRLSLDEQLFHQKNRQALYLLWQEGMIEMHNPSVAVEESSSGTGVIYLTNNTGIRPTKEGIEYIIARNL